MYIYIDIYIYQVCSGSTGHTEGIQLLYDPDVVCYEALCEKLLSTVDPTAPNRVGNDRGTQYRHGIYPHTPAQADAAAAVLEAVRDACSPRPVVTELRPAEVLCVCGCVGVWVGVRECDV